MNTNRIARIASLVGEPARAAMLLELMDGRSLTANELAKAGHVSPQTASRHLAQMVEAGLMVVEQCGRHRYHRLASGEVAKVLEGIMQIAGEPPARRAIVAGPRDDAMRMARMCYDHIAGRLGLAIADRLLATGRSSSTAKAAMSRRERATCCSAGGSCWAQIHNIRHLRCAAGLTAGHASTGASASRTSQAGLAP